MVLTTLVSPLAYASKRIQANKNIVLQAVALNGLALEFAAQELQNDREIVKEAIMQNGLALKFASETLQDDDELVIIALNEKIANEKLKEYKQ